MEKLIKLRDIVKNYQVGTQAVLALTSQIRKVSVKLPKKRINPDKIQDDNQSIHHGVINEKLHSNLRSTS